MNAPEFHLTDRLLLRKPRPADATPLFSGCTGDPEVTRYLLFPRHRNEEDALQFVRAAIDDWSTQRCAHWVVTLVSDPIPVGLVSLRCETNANLSYFLSRAHWNRGIMTEAVTALTRWALTQEEIARVWALCDAENLASIRVLEKAGLAQEALLPRHTIFPNISTDKRDCVSFGRLKA